MSDCCGADGTVFCDHPSGPFARLANELPAEATTVRTAAFGVLRHGRPATATALAETTGLARGAVADVLAALTAVGAVELDAAGDVVGIGGLSLTSSSHELVLEGDKLHTWCALDVLGIPAALRVDAVARSRCHWCGEVVEVVFRAGSPQGDSEVLTWFPRPELSNLRRDFCTAANLFCNREHLDAWLADVEGPPGEALTLAGVVERGRQMWALEAQASDGQTGR